MQACGKGHQLSFSLKNFRPHCGTIIRVRLQSILLRNMHWDDVTLFISAVAKNPQYLVGKLCEIGDQIFVHVCAPVTTPPHTRMLSLRGWQRVRGIKVFLFCPLPPPPTTTIPASASSSSCGTWVFTFHWMVFWWYVLLDGLLILESLEKRNQNLTTQREPTKGRCPRPLKALAHFDSFFLLTGCHFSGSSAFCFLTEFCIMSISVSLKILQKHNFNECVILHFMGAS